MGRDRRWWPPAGASLCAIGGVGTPMNIDLLGGHTAGSIGFSAAVIVLFVAAAVWMFRRWGTSSPRVTLAEEQSDALWAELEQHLDAAPDRAEALQEDPREPETV